MKLSTTSRMSNLSWIWLLFGVVFFLLGCIQLGLAGKSISQFAGAKVEPTNLGAVFVGEVSLGNINKALEKFTEDFNAYIDDYNKASKWQNTIAALGFFAAAFLAFVSMRQAFRDSPKEIKNSTREEV